VEQAAKHCEKAYPGKTIDIEMGSNTATGNADITVASISSLVSGDRLLKYTPSHFKLILVDEAHHIVAPTYLDVLQHFGLYPATKDCPALVGVSATFSRLDGMSLGAAIDHIVYHKDYIDMIDEKWLSGVKFTTVESKADLSKVKKSAITCDFLSGSLSKAVRTKETNDITVKAWLSEAHERKSTLVFCVDIAHVESLTAAFRDEGVNAQYITGSTRVKERRARLEAFRKGEFPVLVNCAIFTEGTDIPNIDCVVLARPTKSRNLLVQMIGRGMRLHPGKDDCHVIDMVASLETGIVTVPTLFGLDPSEIVKDATAEDLRKLKEKRDEDEKLPMQRPSNTAHPDAVLDFTHYETVHDLIEDTSGERHIRAMSPNAWVQVDSSKYMLCPPAGILTIACMSEPAKPSKTKSAASKPSAPDPSPSSTSKTPPDPFTITYKYPLPAHAHSKSPWSAPRTIATASTLASAVAAADTFAASKFERIWLATASPWRRSPASESQLSFLNNLRGVTADLDPESGDPDHLPLTPNDLTKGQANDMITKVKYGARGRFDKLRKQKAKVKREKERWEKEQEIRQRESVAVGALNA
jgi:ATP-dependent helicase IRC3